jgi:hypothetical protein
MTTKASTNTRTTVVATFVSILTKDSRKTGRSKMVTDSRIAIILPTRRILSLEKKMTLPLGSPVSSSPSSVFPSGRLLRKNHCGNGQSHTFCPPRIDCKGTNVAEIYLQE